MIESKKMSSDFNNLTGEKLLRIEYIPIRAATRWDKNPKLHDLPGIIASIRRYGFRDAPIYDSTLSALVAGHGRAAAIESMLNSGEAPPDGVATDPDGVWYIPVQFGNDAPSVAVAEAFAIDHNNLTVSGSGLDPAALWDAAGYADVVRALADGCELPETVGADAAAVLLGLGSQGGADTEPQIDRAEELRVKWGVEPGQLWALGEHRLICGDCTDPAVVERVLQGGTPRLIVTDPPYGVNYDPNWRNEAAEKGFLSYAPSRTGIVHNDDRVDWSDAYKLFPGDVAYTWSPGGDHVILTGLAMQNSGFEIRNQIMWRKPHFPISRGHYTYQHEPCWYGVRKGKKSYWIGDNNASTVWDIALDKNVDGGHSTQKPLECMARPIRNHEGDVYEPFCGSGTTIIATENLKRRCRAIEIDPGYVAVTLQRYLDHTGRQPERLSP